jgi:RNA polymerase sigma-70 factor, ECF subfamily
MPSDSKRISHESVRNEELRAALDRALDALPDEPRLVFVMCEVQQLSGAEAAECLGISEQQIRTLLELARQQLKGVIAPELEPDVLEAYDMKCSRDERIVTRVLRCIAE